MLGEMLRAVAEIEQQLQQIQAPGAKYTAVCDKNPVHSCLMFVARLDLSDFAALPKEGVEEASAD